MTPDADRPSEAVGGTGRPDNGVSVERAQIADFEAIAALDRVAWRGGRFPERIPDGEHVWRIWVEEALVFVARGGGEVVGAIVAFPTCSGRLFVHKVMVQSRRRRRGIGRRLFEALLSEVDEGRLGSCYLTVDPSHCSAIAGYERLGFSERRFVEGYYRADEDRFVLTRPAVTGERHDHAASRPPRSAHHPNGSGD